ncbi:MAG: hypothetical protein IKM39_03785 [Clostridia bacterium]|nr:hypothetical protein [Clostridia bacterium]
MKLKGTLFICWVITLCLLFTLPAMATQKITLSEESMSLYLPDDFTILTEETIENYKELLTSYDTTVTETQIKLTQENYLVLSISQTMHCTLFLSAVEDSVSATIGDLITYSDQATARQLILGKNPPETMEIRELEQRGALFYRVNFGVENKVGRIAYITVLNGKCYTLCLVDNSGSLNDNMNALIDTAFENWDYTVYAETLKIQEFRDTITTIFYWICMPIGLIIGGIIIRMLIKDIRARRQNRQRMENTPKKPRR